MEKKQHSYIENRKLNYNYFYSESFIAGMVLKGSEVKAIRQRKTNISEAYCIFVGNELFVRNMHITNNNIGVFGHDELQDRKLLLKKKELKDIEKWLQVRGNTIIPKRIIIQSNGFIKIEICLCKGKHNYDKRETIKQRDLERYGETQF